MAWRRSSHTPSAAPSSVGTTTDHPTSPIMLNPDQTVRLTWPCSSCALSLRFALAPTRRLNSGSSATGLPSRRFSSRGLLTIKFRETADETAFHFRHHPALVLLVRIKI